MQNGYVERFNRIYRESILDANLFFELEQITELTEEWMNITTDDLMNLSII
jgi:putative transposase